MSSSSGVDDLPNSPHILNSGLPHPTMDVLIIDPETRKEVSVGHIGEVWV